MKRLFSGSLLAAVAMFIFGAVYWSSPIIGAGSKRIADDEVVQGLLRQAFPETGIYWVPSTDLYAQDPERYAALHETGPVAMINIVQDPGPPMAAETFAAGFIHEWLVCFLIGLLLMKAAPALPGYGARVGFVFFAGFVMALFVNLGAVIWWRMPLVFQLADGLYNIAAWLLAGLVLARFVPEQASA